MIRVSALLAFFIPVMAWAQATVDESKESAFIYVDTAVGSDSNPGTQTLPLKTISAAASIAISNNAAGIGTRVIINPGIYREAITVAPLQASTSAPMTFQAATNGTVFVSGAVQYKNWATDTQIANAYTSAWPYRWGFCPADTGNFFEQPIVERREMVFVNGAPMTQVLSTSQMVAPGTFYVDETAGLLHVWPPTGTNMAAADVEVATLPELLTVTALGTGSLNGVVFRGLTFEYAASCRSNDGAVLAVGQTSNLLFDSDQFLWNSSIGLSLAYPVSNVTVINSIANHNGATGFNTWRVKNSLWQNLQASYNNWRGAQGAYYYWNMGGMHFFSDHNETVNNATLIYNQTHAIHWDTDLANITADSIFTSENAFSILTEKSEGPITITNSTFCNSFDVAAAYAGFVLRNSQQTSVTGSTFYNHNVTQVGITGSAGGIQITNWESGQSYNLITQNFSFHKNIVVGTGTEDVFEDGSLGGSDWTSFVATLSSDNNTWWNASNPSAFLVPTSVSGTHDTLAQWQSLTGQDANSVWAAPASDPSAKCAVMADIPDLWFLADNTLVSTDAAGVAVFNLQSVGLGGFNGSVKLVLDGIPSIPSGSATLSKSSLTTNDSAVLTIHTSVTTPPGTYTFTVIANSSAITRTVTLSVTVPTNTVWLSTDSLTFANEPVNFTSPPQVVTLTNLGSSPLPINSITITSGFAQTNTCGSQVAGGASCTISITFSPTMVSAYPGTLTINDGNPSVTQVVTLTGTVVGSGKVSFSPTGAVSFGPAVYLKPSAGKSVTMTNIGTGLMDISSIAVTGTNPSDFTQTNTCGLTLDVNASCVITVVFSPTALGQRTASITVTDDGANSPQSFTIFGTGTTAITYVPSSTTFSSTGIGSTTTVKTVTVTNLSTATLEVSGITIVGANPTDFIQTNTCGAWISGSTSCTVSVQFSPQAAGSRTATLQINDSDPTSPQNVTLTGTGYAISISPKTVIFGSTAIGSTSTGKTVTVTNLGSAAVPVSSIAMIGANPSDFQTGNCGASIPGGTSCTLTLTFSPQVAGSRSATLQINDSDPTSPQTVALSGTGYAISVSPKNVTFSSTGLGSTSAGKTVTVTNSGSSAVSISSIAMIGANPADFHTGNCGASIPGGTSCTITVTFAPQTAGSRTATLQINDSDPTSPQTVTLSGTGYAISVSPTALIFPSTKVGSTGTGKTVTVTNLGSAAVTVSSIAVTGTNASDYQQTSGCGTSIAGGASCTITVTFTPQATGSRKATLTITDGDPTSPQSVTLSGTGT